MKINRLEKSRLCNAYFVAVQDFIEMRMFEREKNMQTQNELRNLQIINDFHIVLLPPANEQQCFADLF